MGSNLGDRLGYIREAKGKLEQSPEIEIRRCSSVYETEPVGYWVKGQGSRGKEQPWFLNMVIELEIALKPLDLLDFLLGIESHMGRKRDLRRGPRNIDLDLLLYDDVVLNSDKLTLPHPRMHQRRFVLVPLAEIAPKVVHPSSKKTAKELLDELSADSNFREKQFEVRLHSETF
jgi:2-amino-4-hydroxy-6-hydroxymethyldihydropteridine diphosphokinase